MRHLCVLNAVRLYCSFTSFLEGEVGVKRREGDKPKAPEPKAIPLPGPPPQGGREQKCAAIEFRTR